MPPTPGLGLGAVPAQQLQDAGDALGDTVTLAQVRLGLPQVRDPPSAHLSVQPGSRFGRDALDRPAACLGDEQPGQAAGRVGAPPTSRLALAVAL